MYNLFMIANIRNFLTTEACHTAILAMVISHLDYANAIMVGLPEKHITKLQRVQNLAAKVVLKKASTPVQKIVSRVYISYPLGIGLTLR